MKRILFLFFYLSFVISICNSQINLAILFDNSGSMKVLSGGGIEDAKKLIFDFIFEGKYDSTKWKASKNTKYNKIWVNNSKIYLHAFGRINKNSFPYFSEEPDLDIRANEVYAKMFIKKYLFSRITLNEPFTNDFLSELVCWKMFDNENKNLNRNYEIHIIKIWDGLPDPESSPVQKLKSERATYKPIEKQIALFQYKPFQNFKNNKVLSLEYKILTIGAPSVQSQKILQKPSLLQSQTEESDGSNLLEILLIVLLIIIIIIGILLFLKRKGYPPFSAQKDKTSTETDNNETTSN